MNIEIKNLTVKVGTKIILNDFSLNIKKGEVHAIMGPNGTGKSTLSKAIMGEKTLNIINGDIICDNKTILNLTTDERARLGIFLVFQNPLTIEGITTSDFIKTAVNENKEEPVGLYAFIKEIKEVAQQLKMPDEMIHRNINSNFSGGERKKSEILQLLMLKPKFIILDELDSGLDIDSLKLVGDAIAKYQKEYSDTSILIITHYPRILEMIKPNRVHVMKNGKITSSGDVNFAKEIEKKGYML